MTQPQGGDQFSLGNAVGYVDIDTSRATTALSGLRGQLQGFFQSTASSFQQVGQTVSNFGQSLSIAMLPVAGAMGTGIAAAGNFQDAMAEIQARAGLTDAAMEQIRATALQLGADTSFSAQQAADAFLNLLTAGLDTEQALAALPHVLTGAAAAGADLGQTAEQVTNIMSSFQLEAAEAARIVEVMNQAAGASPAEMSEMGEALATVGGDARNFGLSLEQTGAILTIFARNGKTGAEAGTQLRSILTAMTADTEDSNQAWEMVNSSLFDANGNARDFGVVLTEVKAGLENLNAEDQAFVIQSLAGSYGRVGFNALLASEGIEAVIGEMGEQSSAAEVAEARLNTFNGRMESLRGSVETLLITAFTPFIEALTPMVEQITTLVNGIGEWINTNQAIVQPILKMLSVLIVMGPVLFGIGKAISLVGFLIGALTSPISLVLIGITAFAAAWASNFLGIRDVVQPVLDGLTRQFSVIAVWFKSRGIVGGLRLLFNTFEDGSSVIGELFRIFGVGQKTANRLGAVINRVLRPAVNGIVTVFQVVKSAFTAFTIGMQEGFTFFESLGYAITTFAYNLGISAPIIEWLRGIFVTFMSVVTPLFDAFNNAFRVFITTFEGGGSLLDSFGAALMTFGATISNALSGVDWAQVGSSILQGLGNALATLGDWASWVYDNLLQPMFSSVQTAITSVNWGEVGASILNALGAAFSTAVSWATWVFDNILKPLWDNFTTALGTVDWAAVGTSILNAIGSALTTLGNWATWIYDNILKPIWNNFTTAIISVDWGQVGNSILTAIGTALTTFAYSTWIYDNILLPMFNNAKTAIETVDWYQVGADIVNGIGAAIKATFDFVAWIIDSIFTPITTNTETAATGIDWSSVGTAIMNAIKGAIIGLFNFVTWLNETIFTPMINGAAAAIANTDWSAVGTNLMTAIGNALPNIATWVTDNIIGPISNALTGFNPFSTITVPPAGTWTNPGGGFGASAGFGSGGNSPAIQGSGGFGSGAVPFGTTIRPFAKGTNFVPRDMLALLHRGESVQPQEYNPAAGGSSGISFDGAIFNIHANNRIEGEQAAMSFEVKLSELLRANG